MSKRSAAIDDWIKKHLKKEPPRSKSLIVTIFGDLIVPLSNELWLSDLIELLEPFGFNERLVRTSTSRLMEDDWLKSEREGRRSRYSVTDSGLQRFEHAYRRIYAAPPREWDSNWTMVILPKTGNGPPERSELRRELEWEGFGLLAPGIFIHPAANVSVVGEILDRLELTQRSIVATAQDFPGLLGLSMKVLVPQCWNLTTIAELYREFLTRFEPLAKILEGGANLTPEQAFIVQTLLIHMFRRVTLHDPRLPAPMLPENWPGYLAYDLCQRLYQLTYRTALSHIAPSISMQATKLVPPPELLNRFGGLK